MMQFQHLHSFMPMKIPSFYGARCDIRILLSFPRFRGVAEKPLCSDQISVEIGAKKTAENGESRWPGTHRDVEPWRQGSFPPKTRPFWPLNFGSTSFGFGKWDPENFSQIQVGEIYFADTWCNSMRCLYPFQDMGETNACRIFVLYMYPWLKYTSLMNPMGWWKKVGVQISVGSL